jgi:hypothetical protein
MAVTRDTLLKIAAIINDEATSEAERAVAQMRLQGAYARYPELFALESAPPTAPTQVPSFNDVKTPDAEPYDFERDSFFRLSDWDGRSGIRTTWST